MGCCVSTTVADLSDKKSGEPSAVSDNNKPPPQPPAIVEEETVKEVLSETTLLTPSNEKPVIENKTPKPITEKIRENDEKPETLKPGRSDSFDPIEDGSEVSEICSLSVSESVSSTVVNPYEDRDEEVKQRKLQGVRHRSPAKPRNRVTGHNNYPTRRSEQSPGKRSVGGGNGSVRLVHPSPGRRSGSSLVDPADRSGRRSRSPAPNRSVSSPGPGNGHGARRKKNIESPGRIRVDPDKSGSGQQLSQWPSSGADAAAENYDSAPRESLENPLVSLECFIFL